MTGRDGAYRNVEPLLRPQSITVVGASERPDSWSARIFRNLRSYGFPGEVYLVNPRHRELYGMPCFPSVTDVPGKIDQLVVIVPAPQVPGILEEGGKRGCRSAVVFSGGFSETNTPVGLAVEQEMIGAAQKYGILIGGPNCLGNVSTRERVLTFAEQAAEPFPVGGLALISQSSGLMGGVARYAVSRGLGLSYCIASGSEANVDAADYLRFLVEDESTHVIGLFLEAIRCPAEFALACERARAAQKPVLILKIGKSKKGREAALTHTAALAGSYEAFTAFCRRYGLVELRGLDECVDAAEIFLRSSLPKTGGVAAISLSGGGRGYLHDLGEELQIDFPPPNREVQRQLEQLLGVGAGAGNPLDLGASGASDLQMYLRCLDLLAADPSVGLIAVQGELPQGPDFSSRAAGYQRMVERAAEVGKPIVFFSRSSHSVSAYAAEFRQRCGAPFLQEIRKSFQAISHVMGYRRALEPRLAESAQNGAKTARFEQDPSGPGISASTTFLSDADAFALIEQAGIPVARYEFCETQKAAQQACQLLGSPVALKASAPGLTHKSEMGGVRLGLSEPAEICQAFDSVQRNSSTWGKSAIPVLVQEMVQGLLELYVGGRSDPEFGPLVLLGLGGVLVEAIGRVSTRLAPVGIAEAEEMLVESAVELALRRLQVEQASAWARIVDAVVKMSQLIAARREISTIEINPLLVRKGDGSCVAVDVVALVRV
ncbi:MAG: acetate--CoA ligase family protein [Candidatus Binatia bacterium]